MKFTHLTFDCYGTLIDWRAGLDSHLGKLLRSNGLTSDVSVYPVYVELEAVEEGKYRCYKDILKDTAIKVADHFRISVTDEEARTFAASVPSWTPFGDTVESLKQLGAKGHKRIILSNIDRDLLQETILQNGLEVDGYITAEDVGSYKPSPAHWNRFFDEYKASKEGTLHVAQSIYHDIMPASLIGIANAWVNGYSDPKPLGMNPTYIVPDLRTLLKDLD
jgi:2-haloalkanoic acid dehalogenase type II